MKNTKSYDVFGNIALVKFDGKTSAKAKRKFAEKIMKENTAIRTILEKTGKFKGRLRKQSTRWIAGEKTKDVLYNENGCVFRFNIDKTYFSQRLSNERKDIASLVKGNVFVMFAGVAPYSIVIARNKKVKKVYSNEISKDANKYAELNIALNKLKGKVAMLNGDIKEITAKVKRGLTIGNEKIPRQFDYIVMPRPRLRESFLKQAFILSKKGTIIFYYGFGDEQNVKEEIFQEARKLKRKISLFQIRKAGEIGVKKFRLMARLKVLN